MWYLFLREDVLFQCYSLSTLDSIVQNQTGHLMMFTQDISSYRGKRTDYIVGKFTSAENSRQDIKLSEVDFYAYARPFIHCLYFICERKVYARTHGKITRHFKSTLKGSSAQNSRAEHFRPSCSIPWKQGCSLQKENKALWVFETLWLAKWTAVVCEMIISASDSPGYNEEIILTQSWVQYENYLQQVRCSGWSRPRIAKITKVQVEQPGKEIIKWELDCAAIGRLKTFYDQRSIHPLYIWVPYFVYRKRF